MALRGGQSGNNNATKTKIWSEALRKYIVQNNKMDALARAAVEKAIEGDVGALREIGDRLEGKVAQQIIGAGDSGEHLVNASLEISFATPQDQS